MDERREPGDDVSDVSRPATIPDRMRSIAGFLEDYDRMFGGRFITVKHRDGSAIRTQLDSTDLMSTDLRHDADDVEVMFLELEELMLTPTADDPIT